MGVHPIWSMLWFVPAFTPTPIPPPPGAPEADASRPDPLIGPLAFDPVIRFDPTESGGADEPKDLVGPAGLEPISFETTLLRRDALASTLDDGPLFEPFDPGASVTRPIRLGFQRETGLIDGGFGSPPEANESASTYFAPGGERFDRFNLALEWAALGEPDSLQWLLIGGVQAIRADLTRLDAGETDLGLSGARGTVAIPTVGTGLRWSPVDRVYISTIATSQSGATDASLLDLSASAELRLSPFIGITTGYEYLRSGVTVDDLRTTLNREGVFARLMIRF
jgi:hypothetical protein